ncbi:MAG: redoxin domain-containing protein [Proteobacteria bacterium]|nr:redoxin domain-containing protein [Pseudomonadota bacterium]
MRRTLCMLGLSLAAAMPALAALQAGELAPEFSALASLGGKTFNYVLADELKKGPVVVYFYPSAFTEGCNVEAHTFSVHKADFDAAGASIIGVSLDSIDRLNAFSADPKYCAGKIAVASDAEGLIAKGYQLKVQGASEPFRDTRGVLVDHAFAERTTFIVTPDHRVYTTIGGLSPAANVETALKAVRQLAKTHAAK